jgi:Flp pilus assembly protein TadB
MYNIGRVAKRRCRDAGRKIKSGYGGYLTKSPTMKMNCLAVLFHPMKIKNRRTSMHVPIFNLFVVFVSFFLVFVFVFVFVLVVVVVFVQCWWCRSPWWCLCWCCS